MSCFFKVTDWITLSGGRPWRATEFDIVHLDCNEDVELWQPKEGEWCWFKDEKNTIGSLTQLVGIEEDGTYYGYSSCGIPDKAPCVEPFIGELPTFLKDNK